MTFLQAVFRVTLTTFFILIFAAIGTMGSLHASPQVVFIGVPEELSGLTDEEQEAYQWLQSVYNSEYISFDDIRQDPQLLDDFDVIWWHNDEQIELPESAVDEETVTAIEDFISKGGGLFLSGLASQYAVDLGIQSVPPAEISRDGATSGDWGFYQMNEHHPAFDGLNNPFATISSGLEVANRISWWTDPDDFDGTWLTDLEWRSDDGPDIVSSGEYELGEGTVFFVGAGAFEWHHDGENTNRDNLETYTANIIDYLSRSVPEIENGLIAYFPLDGSSGDRRAEDLVSGSQITINNNYDRPEWVEGPTGSGLRLDGFSTWIGWNQFEEHMPTEQLSIELWAAVESYPPANAPFVNSYTFPDAGYYLGMEPLGAWYFAVSIDGDWHTVWGDGKFPKGEWAHIAGVFDQDEGLKLYKNGELVGTENTPGLPMTPDRDNPTIIGKDVHSDEVAVFPTGVVNGLVDDVRIYNIARSDQDVQETFESGEVDIPANLEVPESRYTDDPHRPEFHAIPPAHWANEPHGLVYHEDRYHMFYQYNPSGPYWAHIHWGHMSTDNLVGWDHHPIAKAPEPGFDSYGIWSGDAVVDNNTLKTIYTGVDGARAGVGLAEMRDYGDFEKDFRNPLFRLPDGNYEDFRDPYVWREGDTWYLTIGTGVPQGGGGVALLYRSDDLINWEFRGEMKGEGNPDESGEYWEMPMLKQLTDDIYYFGVTDLPIGRNTYWLGSWENEEFTPNHDDPHRLDLINRFLSPAIERTPDGRIVAVGIIPNHVTSEFAKELGWEHTFSLPREWYYHEEDEIMGQRPVRELEQLRGEHTSRGPISLGDGRGSVLDKESTTFEMIADFNISDAEEAGVILRASPDRSEQTRIYYDTNNQEIVVDLSEASNNPDTERDVRTGDFELGDDENLRLHVFVDNSVIEVFVNDSRALATRVFPTQSSSNQVDLFASGGTASATVDYWEIDARYTSINEEPAESDVPDQINLNQNYPNPFNSATNISFEIPETSGVRLEVYNILGQHVRTLVDGRLQSGTHQATFDGSGLASGVYIYRLQVGNEIRSKKMMLLE